MILTDAYLYNSTQGVGVWRVPIEQLFVSNKELPSFSNEITIYPNPAADFFTLEKPSRKNISGILQIFDLNGRKIRAEKIEKTNSYQVDLKNISKGIYFLQLTESEQVTTGKLILE